MKFKFVISKWANFYFFITIISGLKERKDYIALWKKEISQFSGKERKLLNEFKKLHLKYFQKEIYLWNYFFTNSISPWKEIKKITTSSDYEIIKKTFEIFRKKFEKLYKKDYPLLKQWGKILNHSFSKNIKINNKIINILSILYKVYPLKKEVIIYLLFSSPQSGGGGFHRGYNRIALETSRRSLSNINKVIGIIWHELIHLYFDHIYFIPMIYKIIKNDQAVFLIKEIATSSLFPNGILGMNLLSTPQPRQLHSIIKPDLTSKVLKLTGYYIKNHKSFDKIYINQILKIMKNNK